MLVLGRRDGDWTRIVHSPSGDELWVRSYDLRCGRDGGTVSLAFDDPDRIFAIERPEAMRRRNESPDQTRTDGPGA